jgi:hypothetical protein
MATWSLCDWTEAPGLAPLVAVPSHLPMPTLSVLPSWQLLVPGTCSLWRLPFEAWLQLGLALWCAFCAGSMHDLSSRV